MEEESDHDTLALLENREDELLRLMEEGKLKWKGDGDMEENLVVQAEYKQQEGKPELKEDDAREEDTMVQGEVKASDSATASCFKVPPLSHSEIGKATKGAEAEHGMEALRTEQVQETDDAEKGTGMAMCISQMADKKEAMKPAKHDMEMKVLENLDDERPHLMEEGKAKWRGYGDNMEEDTVVHREGNEGKHEALGSNPSAQPTAPYLKAPAFSQCEIETVTKGAGAEAEHSYAREALMTEQVPESKEARGMARWKHTESIMKAEAEEKRRLIEEECRNKAYQDSMRLEAAKRKALKEDVIEIARGEWLRAERDVKLKNVELLRARKRYEELMVAGHDVPDVDLKRPRSSGWNRKNRVCRLGWLLLMLLTFHILMIWTRQQLIRWFGTDEHTIGWVEATIWVLLLILFQWLKCKLDEYFDYIPMRKTEGFHVVLHAVSRFVFEGGRNIHVSGNPMKSIIVAHGMAFGVELLGSFLLQEVFQIGVDFEGADF